MNTELTYNNHFVWGYNQIPWSKRVRLYDRFFATYGKAEYTRPWTLRDACIDAARKICKQAKSVGKKPMVFYSGGLDSEVVIAAFLQSGEDFTVAHLKYTPELNYHDSEWVYRFCRLNNLDLKEYEIDPIEYFLRPEVFDQAVKDNIKHFEMVLVNHLMDLTKDEYFPVLGNGEPYLFKINNDNNSPWLFRELEYMMPWYFHAFNNDIHSCPGFFQYTPEVMLSFLLDPTMVKLANNMLPGKITSRTSKFGIYTNAFPEYEFQPRRKYTGYEYIPRNTLNTLNQKICSYTFYDKHSYEEIEYNKLVKLMRYGNPST
jgi:hypothetical protein